MCKSICDYSCRELCNALSKRFRLSLMTSKTLTDVGALAFGVCFIKAPIGLGTTFIPFCVVPDPSFLFLKSNSFFTSSKELLNKNIRRY